ncbi:MAG: hypothetical protein J6C59_00310, partial [Muribaculaceae bacterium]|nr:hypothetical protein [Muribaculaceae bacterium]
QIKHISETPAFLSDFSESTRARCGHRNRGDLAESAKKAKFMICEINPITYYRFNLNTYLITNIGAKVQKNFRFSEAAGTNNRPFGMRKVAAGDI